MFLSQSAFLFLMPWQCWSSATGQQTCLVLFAQVTCPGSSVIRVCLPIRAPGYMVLNTLFGWSFTWMLLCPLITMFIHSTNIYWVPGTVLGPGNIKVNKIENKTTNPAFMEYSNRYQSLVNWVPASSATAEYFPYTWKSFSSSQFSTVCCPTAVKWTLLS